MSNKITSSSTAEYFAKNLQQVGFSSPTKAVLTTLKEAVDNSLDACEMVGILPEISIEIKKLGNGSQKNTDLLEIIVEDNGPGIDPDDIAKVFGEYLASSKFGRGQCSRGQQGIGISAATTWAQLTNAKGAEVITKTKTMRKAFSAVVNVDIKSNKGVIQSKESIEWNKAHGLRVKFTIDGRTQLNGEGGLLTYLEGSILLNPHLTMKYKLLEADWQTVPRVSEEIPEIPKPVEPHPHTMKLGEFMTHASLFGNVQLSKFLRSAFSRVSDATLSEFVKKGLPKSLLTQNLQKLREEDFKKIYAAVQETELMSPSTKSVLMVGEEALSKSVLRLGEVDFFSVVTRKPRICDFKPVVVEVAIARTLERNVDHDEPVRLLRFANRVPLQFDKGNCAITKAIESVNWRNYGLNQPKNSVPRGPYVIAISVVSPFIKFKNASKETIDASDELVEEIRLALMQAGQRLSYHIKRENKAADLERKMQHIEKFGPILVEGLVNILKAPATRKTKALEGLNTLLGREADLESEALVQAEEKSAKLTAHQKKMLGEEEEFVEEDDMAEETPVARATKKTPAKNKK